MMELDRRIQQADDSQELSSLRLAAALFAKKKIISYWTVMAIAIGVVVAYLRSPVYQSSTTLVLAAGESGNFSQLRGLASQFGVNVGNNTRGSEITADMVVKLATSPAVLRPLATDSIRIAERGPSQTTFADLLEVEVKQSQSPNDDERRTRSTVKAIADLISVNTDRKTGSITMSVSTPWPSLSLMIVQRVTSELDRYLFNIGRQRAALERKVIEERLATQDRRLAEVEAKLASFLGRNRAYQNSPDLRFEYERLQRSVALQQQVLVSLAQAREEVLSREIQSAPSLTILEPAMSPVLPEPSKRVLIILIASLLGTFAGVAWVLLSLSIREALSGEHPDARMLREELARIGITNER